MARLNINIDNDTYARLQELASQDERSVSLYVRRLLRKACFGTEKPDQHTLSDLSMTHKKNIIG